MTKIAIAQHAPAYFDVDQSLARLEVIVGQASREGAELVVFGETWLSGYPAWLDRCSSVALWDHEPTKRVFARMRASAVVVGGAATQRIASLAKAQSLAIVLGCSERVDSGPGSGTLYNALLVFDEQGRLAVHRRKLVPTHSERLVWGPGDGRDLRSAPIASARVGALICWEHWMPLARQAMHDAGEQIHVALWPEVHDIHQLASRHYAFEGRCFVVAAGLIMPRGDIPDELQLATSDDLVLRGGSAVIAPDGSYVVEPVLDREELIVCDIDLEMVDRERMTLDVSGHYARPDVFRFEVVSSRRGDGER